MDYIILVRCDGGLLGRTLLERGPCWLGLFAGHGAHGAGACRALCVEADFRHRGQPGHHARTCPLKKQGTAAAAHPRAYFSEECPSTASCTPLQGLWDNKAHTYRLARTYAHTHAHIHTRMRKHTQTQKCANTRRLAHAHTHAHAQTHRHARAHIQTPKDTGTHTHAHTHTCICMHMLRALWASPIFQCL